jgi:hypothetical protein
MSQSPPPPPSSPSPITPSRPTINIGEEFGTAKRNLPPGKIVVIAIVLVGIVVAIASFLNRAKPQASGTIDNVSAVEVPGQGSTMVALTFTLHNSSDRILYVHVIQSSIKSSGGDATADAVSAIDFDRYFQAFPALKTAIQPALTPETKIQPGETVTRSIIVAFQKTLDVFNQRQSISVIVWPYDQTVPVVMTR